MSGKDRARILAEYEVLDSLPEKEFDDIVELASAICGTPISAISLLDLDRQWFKAQVGLNTRQTPLDQSFCRYAVHTPDDVMVITDSLNDDRFKNNPLTLGDPHISFYAGAPLVTEDGIALGALCVIDRQPREFTELERRMLQILAKRVMKLLDLRRENLRQKKVIRATSKQLDLTLKRLLEAQSIGHIGNWDWNMQTGEIYWSPQMYELMHPHSKPGSIDDNTYFDRILHPDDIPVYHRSMEQLRLDHKTSAIEFRIVKGSKEMWVMMRSEDRLHGGDA